jgi:Domain of unknown function DUF29
MMGTAGFSFKAGSAMFNRAAAGVLQMSELKPLYDEDFYLWSKQQAEALRAAGRGATNYAIDWENVAEEIDSLARSEKRELGSQIRRIIEHLLKLENSRAADPRMGWIASIGDARNEIEVLLEDSPSLKTEVDATIGAEMKRGSRKAITELEKYGEVGPATLSRVKSASYTEDQILGDWFPPEPSAE